MGLFYAFLHPQKHIHLHISKNITRNPAELWDIKNRRVPNTRLLLSLVGATMSKFAKCQHRQIVTNATQFYHIL